MPYSGAMGVVLLVAGVVCVLIITIYIAALRVARSSIFPGSGSPKSMAQTLLSSIHVVSQHLLGAMVITLICVLMVEKTITSEAGLPLLSAVAGYLLAKTFKDVNISPADKNKDDGEEE